MTDTIKCPACGLLVPAPNLNVSVVNEANVSLMICIHEHGVECSCGTYLKPAIVALPSGIFSWMPCEKPLDAPLVRPASLILQ